MKEPQHTISPQLPSSHVLLRLVFRLALLSVCAAFSSRGFAITFAALLALSTIFCATIGALRQEAIFGPRLTHWDEAAAYAVIGRLAFALS